MSEADRRKWNERHGARRGEPLVPEPFLAEALDLLAARGLPSDRTALDVACGRGRHALPLARAGFDVLAIDVADVALVELDDAARREGLRIRTLPCDLDVGLPPEARGPFGLVVVVHFLERSLLPSLRAAVAPGGALAYETFLAGPPDLPRSFCLEPGELLASAGDLEVLLCREGASSGRRVASLVAVR